ncbi:hypothetical protein Bbelb_264220 [Branchiostoma belcheri]|nr:hypothetical protein Bbelb_264220 [Branchiostoma belcheri]
MIMKQAGQTDFVWTRSDLYRSDSVANQDGSVVLNHDGLGQENGSSWRWQVMFERKNRCVGMECSRLSLSQPVPRAGGRYIRWAVYTSSLRHQGSQREPGLSQNYVCRAVPSVSKIF